MIKKNMLDTIGNTPLVSLERLVKNEGLEGEILAKIEYYSPGLSKKDRVAKYIIEQAENRGILKKGQTVIEQTSGNTGIGLAAVCAIKGYPFIAVMSEGNSIQRQTMIKMFGGKIFLVKQAKNSIKGKVSKQDMELVEAEFNRLAIELNAFKAGQFYNHDNANAHYHTTAAEIIKETKGKYDAFVDFIGTGGSYCGIALKLIEANPNCQVFYVEPSAVVHPIQGGGYFKEIPFMCEKISKNKIIVSGDESLEFMRKLARTEAIAGGISSGANLAAAVKYLKDNPGKRVIFLVNDVALKYDSEIFNEEA